MLRASIMSVGWVTLVVPASAFDLVVVNESNYSVLQKLYIAPAKTKNWSDDKLQNQTVGKNGRFTIHDVSKGIYDLKETDDDNDTCVFPNISVDQNTEPCRGWPRKQLGATEREPHWICCWCPRDRRKTFSDHQGD